MSEKNLIITGAGGGIGRALTMQALEANYSVLATDIDEHALHNLAIDCDGKPLITAKLDVTNEENWQAITKLALSEWDCIHGLVNNAGLLYPKYLNDISTKEITDTIDVNVKGVMLGTTIAAKAMSGQDSGHIVNIASMGGLVAVPGIAVYSASKFAVRGFSLAAAVEYRELGIKICTVCPDAVETPMLDIQKDKEEAALTFSGSRPLTADEVADAILTRALSDHPPEEIILPTSRGVLAKMANISPGLYNKMLNSFKKTGMRNQKKLRSSASS